MKMKIDIYVVMMFLMTIVTDIAHCAVIIRSWTIDPVYALWMIAALVCFNCVMVSLTLSLNDEEES